jgi:hypothetical protein
MKVRTENDNNFGYEKITILVDNIPLSKSHQSFTVATMTWLTAMEYLCHK